MQKFPYKIRPLNTEHHKKKLLFSSNPSYDVKRVILLFSSNPSYDVKRVMLPKDKFLRILSNMAERHADLG